MSATSSKSSFLGGFLACLPFVLMAAPFGFLFGVVATEAGLNIAQVMAFSTVVIAGAAQYAAVQLLVEEAPTLIVIGSAMAVNLRMVMYSASLQPHIGRAHLWQRLLVAYTNFDQTFALSLNHYEDHPEKPPMVKAWYFLGAASVLVPVWIIATWAGAQSGTAIPEDYALDIVMPVMFLSMVGPALRSLAHIAAALTAIVLALALAWMPFNLGLICAALPAMAVGAELERRGYGR